VDLFSYLCTLKKREVEKLYSSKAPEPVGSYPHARKVGNLLFLSGIGPRTKGSKEIPGVKLDEKGSILSYDIEAQCHSVFNNIKTVLEEAGSNWNKMIDVTVFLTNMKADFPTYNRIYAEYFKENQPCRTTVEITSLPTPIAIELKVIAMI
jgi:2-aminomuconate deaminase